MPKSSSTRMTRKTLMEEEGREELIRVVNLYCLIKIKTKSTHNSIINSYKFVHDKLIPVCYMSRENKHNACN